MKRVLIVWGNWGPYHHARFEAFRSRGMREELRVEGVELFPKSGIYGWKNDGRREGMHHLDLGDDEMAFRPWLLSTRLAPLILRLRPAVVFVPSYWHWSLFLNAVSRLAGARIVMMNESHAGTERARGLKRRIKRRIVSSFHAALVGGTPHRRHFENLGLSGTRIFTGYDAIDNARFTAAADEARAAAAAHRGRLGLPPAYFLSLGRFVPKKNLPMLVDAFAGLRPRPDGGCAHLVFVGSGETEPALRERCRHHGLAMIDHPPGSGPAPAPPASTPAVHFFGFRQIEENPVFYGLAQGFILPSLHEEWGLVVNEAMACGLPVLVSRTAGCAEDLVAHEENGFLFDPDDAGALRESLRRLVDDPTLVGRMGAASRRRIARWGCDHFAEGAVAATRAALLER